MRSFPVSPSSASGDTSPRPRGTGVSSVEVRCHVVIPCAGSGARAGGDLPKQYQLLAGEPMVVHTLCAFAAVPQCASVLLVVAPEDARMAGLLDELALPHVRMAPVGGATRADSVLAGLLHLSAQGAADDDWVLVHDAARCLVTPAQIESLVASCADDAVGGLLALPLADTLKAARDGRVAQTVPRDGKWQAQTPQMFRLGLLRDALQAAQREGFDGITDEASAIERLGHAPLLVEASAQNFKVTYPQDFFLAEAVLMARRAAA